MGGQKVSQRFRILSDESWDGGLFWTFFDNEGVTEHLQLCIIKPDLSEQLIIPKKIEKAEPVSSKPKTKNVP